jgi:hypothetical protein
MLGGLGLRDWRSLWVYFQMFQRYRSDDKGVEADVKAVKGDTKLLNAQKQTKGDSADE